MLELEASNLRICLVFWPASNPLHSLKPVFVRSNLCQLFLLYSKHLCCLDIFAGLVPRTVSVPGECIFHFFICFQVCWDKIGLSNEYASLFTRGEFPKIKKICEEAKAIVKIETVFFIIFKPNYRDLI